MLAARLMRVRAPLGRPLACNARRALKTTVAIAQWYEAQRTATNLVIATVVYDSCDEDDEREEKRSIPERELKEFLASYMKTCVGLQSLVIEMCPYRYGRRDFKFDELLHIVEAGVKHCPLLEEFNCRGSYDDEDCWTSYGGEGGMHDSSLMAMADYVKKHRGIIWSALKKLVLTNCRFDIDHYYESLYTEGYEAIKASAKEVWPGLDLVLDDMDKLKRQVWDDFASNEADC
eukprot:gene6657-3321_t